MLAERSRRCGGPSSGRGQMTVDFVVGVVVFVVAVAVVVGFVPQLFEPYANAEATVVVDRVADDLVGDLFAASGEPPGTLNETCTIAFFGGSVPASCPFDDAASLEERVGVDETFSVNVTVEWDTDGDDDTPTEILCTDGSNVVDCGSDRLAVGPPVPDEHRSIGTATRVARVEDRTVLVRIRVWSS